MSRDADAFLIFATRTLRIFFDKISTLLEVAQSQDRTAVF
jgi:hypothetical protein